MEKLARRRILGGAGRSQGRQERFSKGIAEFGYPCLPHPRGRGETPDASREGVNAMRALAVQQLAFLATAAAILFVGAVIVGLI